MFSVRAKSVFAIVLRFLHSRRRLLGADAVPKMDADSAAIKQCVAAWEDAWNRHDAHATATAYVEDGDFSALRAFRATAWKDLEAHYNEIFTTFLKDAHRTDTVRNIRFLTPDIAAVDIDWQMTGAKTRDGKDIPVRKGLLNLGCDQTAQRAMDDYDLPRIRILDFVGGFIWHRQESLCED